MFVVAVVILSCFILAIVLVAVVAVARLTLVSCFAGFGFGFACLCFVWLKIPRKPHFPCNFRVFPPALSQKPFCQNPFLLYLSPSFLLLLLLLLIFIFLLSPFLPSSSLFPLLFANPFSNNYCFCISQSFFLVVAFISDV